MGFSKSKVDNTTFGLAHCIGIKHPMYEATRRVEYSLLKLLFVHLWNICVLSYESCSYDTMHHSTVAQYKGSNINT